MHTHIYIQLQGGACDDDARAARHMPGSQASIYIRMYVYIIHVYMHTYIYIRMAGGACDDDMVMKLDTSLLARHLYTYGCTYI